MQKFLHALTIAILSDAGADKTSSGVSRPSMEQDRDNETQGYEKVNVPKTPRFTWDGCLCIEKWRLQYYEQREVSSFCGNPDLDSNGEWCFVVNSSCQPHAHWGYCSPEPRCLVGSSVLAPSLKGYSPGELEAYRDRTVVVRWPGNLVNVIGMQYVTTLDGQECVYQKSTTLPDVAATTTTTASVTIQSHQSDHHKPSSSSLVAYDPAIHGPALAVRFKLEFEKVQRQQTTFKSTVISAAALVLNEPFAAVEVLSIMSGSVIVAIGVVPSACSSSEQTATIACTRALISARQRWEVSIQTPNSILTQIVGPVDQMFATMLDASECARRNLVCPWIVEGGHTQPKCLDDCTENLEYKGRDPWWFMSLIAFAGATPTCLCLGILSFKGCARGCRYYRHRRHVKSVRADAISLPRVEVQAEDLHLGEDWLCAICLMEMSPELDLILLPCKHTLHFDCGMEWLERKLVCPMCRSPCRMRDCAVYTTPTLVTSFERKDESADADAEELFEESIGTLSTRQETSPQQSSNAGADQGESQSFLRTRLPNVICDEDRNRSLS